MTELLCGWQLDFAGAMGTPGQPGAGNDGAIDPAIAIESGALIIGEDVQAVDDGNDCTDDDK